MQNKKWATVRFISDALICVIVTATVITIVKGTYVCPFYAIFDLPCPGCGITRACKAMLRFDLEAAFGYNCLFPIPIVWAIYYLFRKRIRLPEPVEKNLVMLSIVLFFTRWIFVLILI